MGVLKGSVKGTSFHTKEGIAIPTGETLTVAGVEVNAETLAVTGLTATAAELNVLDGITATTAELNTLDGITASVAELNKLDGVGAVVASGTSVAHQADLANDANGTAIAAAVNGLRDVLVAFGMMADAT